MIFALVAAMFLFMPTRLCGVKPRGDIVVRNDEIIILSRYAGAQWDRKGRRVFIIENDNDLLRIIGAKAGEQIIAVRNPNHVQLYF